MSASLARRAVYVYRSDSDPAEYWVAGLFDSRDAYTSNSASPEQTEQFRRLREVMAADPEWHDGEVVVAETS